MTQGKFEAKRANLDRKECCAGGLYVYNNATVCRIHSLLYIHTYPLDDI